MRLETDLGSFEVDTETAEAARDGLHALRDLAEAVGLVDRGPCDHCGTKAALHPWPLTNEEGQLMMPEVCADCRDELKERTQAAHASQSAGRVDSVSLDEDEPDA